MYNRGEPGLANHGPLAQGANNLLLEAATQSRNNSLALLHSICMVAGQA
jgi:hypothetical protein